LTGDDLVSRHAGHGRTRDGAGQPVPCFDEVVLRLLVLLHGLSETVGGHAPQHAIEASYSSAVLGWFL
jgi:hypothetical protein